MDSELFVGRAHEIAALRAALQQAIERRATIVVLAGQPGIGKTRTAQQFAAEAGERDVLVLWGRCREEPGAPPYWPWVQALRTLVDSMDEAALGRAAGSSAAVLCEIVPEIGEALGAASAPALDDPAQQRFRLFDAIAAFCRRAAELKPLLVILDDVHNADPSSLRLLEFLGAEIAASRTMILGAYRDIEVTRQHPLSDTLSELARSARFQRLVLSGLKRDETAAFLASAVGPGAGRWVDTVQEKSEGNPLFVAELARLIKQGEALRGDAAIDRIPEGIREALGRRLNRLSLLCNRVLTTAAAIGRSFELPLLVRVIDGVSEEECTAALDEALAAHVVEALPQAGAYQFAHALIRDMLYEELLAARRVRLNWRIAEAMEEVYAHDLDPHLMQLAWHFHEAAALDGGAKALAYAERAGDRAAAMLAFEDAIRSYRMALEIVERAPQSPATRCRLLLALGSAQNAAGTVEACLETSLEAAAFARKFCLSDAFLRAALGYEHGGWQLSRPSEQAVALLNEALQLADPKDERVLAELHAALCRSYIYCDRAAEARSAHGESVRLARGLADPRLLFKALAAIVPGSWPEQLADRLAAARDALQVAKEAGRLDWATGHLTAWYFAQLAEIGDIGEAKQVLELHIAGANSLRQPFLQAVGKAGTAMMAMREGRLADAEDCARETFELARRFAPENASGVYGMQMFIIERLRGRLADVLPSFRQFVDRVPASASWRPGLCLMLAELEMRDRATSEFEALAADGFATIPRDAMWLAAIVFLAEVCARFGDGRRAALLYRRLAPFAGRNVVVGNVAYLGATDRYLGLLAATSGDASAAERHFDAAVAIDAKSGARPWLAFSRTDYAAWLIARGASGDSHRARGLLDFAHETARELGLAALERRIAAIERDAAPPARPRYPAGLSKREVEVLRLVAAGKGNREIGRMLYLSENTVANHVRNILAKTNSANRTEAAAFAVKHAL